MFAGTDNGVWALTAGTWTHVATPFTIVDDLHVDPSLNRILVAGDAGFASSLDGGMTWQLGNSGLPGDSVEWICDGSGGSAAHPFVMGDLAAQELFLSTDGGMTWSGTSMGGYAAAFDPTAPTFVAYSSYVDGIVVSSDHGATFSTIDLRSAAMDYAGARGRAFDDTAGLYAATGRGMFYAPDRFARVDGARRWSRRVEHRGDRQVPAPGELYATTFSGVLHSTDGGATWSVGFNGLCNNSQVTGVQLVPGAPDSIIVGGINCIARSDDRGQTFSSLYNAQAADSFQIGYLQLVGSTLIAGTGGGVVTSPAPYTRASRITSSAPRCAT